jgi:phosphoribosylglycinamide formyltransferase-1
MKKIGIITYHYPHLKTEQVLINLLQQYSPEQLVIYALPFSPRPGRTVLINHRPDMSISVGAEVMAKAHGISYTTVNFDYEIPNGLDYYLILGAGILSAEFTRGKKTINTHPGIIPAVRGLDAFKWSIYEMKPLGVTMHFIDEHVDAGEIICILPTPVYINDTFETLCRRHYELELYMTTRFEYYLENPTNVFAGIEVGEPHRRMSAEKEAQMVEMFEEYKKKMAASYTAKPQAL